MPNPLRTKSSNNNSLSPHSVIVTRWEGRFPVRGSGLEHLTIRWEKSGSITTGWEERGSITTRWEESGSITTRWERRGAVDLFHPEVQLFLVGSLEQVLSTTRQAENTFPEVFFPESLTLLYYISIKSRQNIFAWVKIHLSLKTCCFLV